jgi:hypothetical protein
MRRNTNRQTRKVANGSTAALKEYVALLYEVYPPARGTTRVAVKPDNRVIVNVPLPSRARDRMRLFDQMAEVGTKLLLETDQYIILSGR